MRRVEQLTCGNNDGAVRLEAAVAALNVHELLHANVRAKACLQQILPLEFAVLDSMLPAVDCPLPAP